MNMKMYKRSAAFIAAVLLSACAGCAGREKVENDPIVNQNSFMVVVAVNECEDTVTFEDGTGNLWAIYGVEDWRYGDIARVTIENGEITSTTYRGFIAMDER